MAAAAGGSAPDWVWGLAGSSDRRVRATLRKRWRAERFALDFWCPRCERLMHDGPPMDGRQCTVDHVVPTSRGGADRPGNWALLCRDCNSEKGNKE